MHDTHEVVCAHTYKAAAWGKVEICDMAGHAVVYKFDLPTQSWAKLDIEGSLFVV